MTWCSFLLLLCLPFVVVSCFCSSQCINVLSQLPSVPGSLAASSYIYDAQQAACNPYFRYNRTTDLHGEDQDEDEDEKDGLQRLR